ncbi:potassium channel family protein [Actinokineospora bangkokensis]|uniref:potassium channel family protein n=1 Tax=Actinokineospora bangkokensis TaxID=1193682 RepID=UPI001E2D7B1E|nr:potassium channel family protein [Actinokineospora bangkokensis]
MSGRDDPEQRLSRWEARTDWAMTSLAVAFLGTYAWQVLGAGSSPRLHGVLEVALWVIWAVFAAEYAVRFSLARNKGRFVWRHLFDLLAVALPMVRQLRALRLVTVFKVLNKRLGADFRGRIGVYVAGTTALVVFCAALAVYDAERRSPDATITGFGDALWWTMTTISTVGYGDRYPVTPEGRLVAVSLMVGGIALLGVVTGVIASWFVEKISGVEESIEETTRAEVAALRAEVAALREVLAEAALRRGPPGPG